MRSGFVRRLIVACVTNVAKIAKRMRLMPARPIRIDGFLGLRFMTVLARRSLRTALRARRCGCRQKKRNNYDDCHASESTMRFTGIVLQELP